MPRVSSADFQWAFVMNIDEEHVIGESRGSCRSQALNAAKESRAARVSRSGGKSDSSDSLFFARDYKRVTERVTDRPA